MKKTNILSFHFISILTFLTYSILAHARISNTERKNKSRNVEMNTWIYTFLFSLFLFFPVFERLKMTNLSFLFFSFCSILASQVSYPLFIRVDFIWNESSQCLQGFFEMNESSLKWKTSFIWNKSSRCYQGFFQREMSDPFILWVLFFFFWKVSFSQNEENQPSFLVRSLLRKYQKECKKG